MKKILFILLSVLFVSNINAKVYGNKWCCVSYEDEGIHIENVAMTDKHGVNKIIWVGDTTNTKIYVVDISEFNQNTNTYQTFLEISADAKAFVIKNHEDFYGISTSTMIALGDSYKTIEFDTEYEHCTSSWEDSYKYCVNEKDSTLKPGKYVVTVRGYDNNWNITENYDFKIFTVKEKDYEFAYNVVADLKHYYMKMNPVKVVKKYKRDDNEYILDKGRILDTMGCEIDH